MSFLSKTPTVHWDTLFSGSGAYQLIYSGLITVSHTYFISEKKYDTKKSGKHIECVRGAEKSVKVKSVRYHEKTGTNKMRQCTVYCNVCSVAYNVCSVAYNVCNGAYNNPKIVQIKRTQSTSITSQILGTMKNTCLK